MEHKQQRLNGVRRRLFESSDSDLDVNEDVPSRCSTRKYSRRSESIQDFSNGNTTGLLDKETDQSVDIEDSKASVSSEAPSDSLNSTGAVHGDPEDINDTSTFLDYEWGSNGTMKKILLCIKTKAVPVTVQSLMMRGPVPPGCRKMIATKCLFSILHLEQRQFINIIKNPITFEIEDIILGPKFA